MIDIESMRQLDTGALVTLKQRIERELMRRGDVEQDDAPVPERMTKAEWTELYLRGELTVDVPVGYLSEPGHYRIGGLQRVSKESQSRFSNVTCETLPTDVLSEWNPVAPVTDETQLFAVDGALDPTPTPLVKRQLLREPDDNCTKCAGNGIYDGTNWDDPRLQLCPCLWGGE